MFSMRNSQITTNKRASSEVSQNRNVGRNGENMEEQQDVTKQLQNPSPLERRGKRTYIRELLEAFEPHQDALFADLDQQIEESNPDLILHQLDEVRKREKRRDTQLHQLLSQIKQKETADEEVNAVLTALTEEMVANGDEELELLRQLRIAGQQNRKLKYKREHLVELLQTMHSMRQEGVWENIGGIEKSPQEIEIVGVRFICFDFPKHTMLYQAIEDIYQWMRQVRPDCLPFEEVEDEESPPKKPAETAQHKRANTTKLAQPEASSAQSSISPAQTYERQAWIRLLVSAHRYSSYFQDHLGELGVFVYGQDKGTQQAKLHLWANGTKLRFPVLEGAIKQLEMLTVSMGSWLTLAWETATGRVGRRDGRKDDARQRTKSDADT
jgi:hypothetical protein